MTINVIDVNNSPVATNDSISVNENSTAEQTNSANGILSNDTDSDNDSLTIENFRTGSESGSGDYGILGSSREGTFGSLTLNGDGTYSYVADLSEADALAAGVTGTDVYTYSVSDGKGGDTGEINFTITGVNDAPHIVDAIAKKKYTEGQGATIIIDGSLSVTDVDDSTIESASVTISSGYQTSEDILGFSNTSEINGSWDAASGQLSLTGTATKSAYAAALATVTYSNRDDLNPVLGHRTVSWQVNDGSAASNTASSIIDVGGVNDSPESLNDTGSVDAGSSLNVLAGSGLLSNDTDPESDNLFVSDIRTGSEHQSGTDGSVSSALTGSYGELTVSANGSYTYSANQAAADALAEGSTAIDVFTYTLNDGTDEDLGELTITVTGTNNAPTGSDDSKPVNENESINVSAITGVLINDSDVDGDDLTITAVEKASGASNRRLSRDSARGKKKNRKLSFRSRGSELSSSTLPQLTGTYGELTLNSDGSFVYDANQSATDALNEGDSVTDSFTYTISDSKTTSSATLEMNVTGINDYPTIASLSQGTISEIEGSSQTQTSGLSSTVTATDVDTNASLEFGILGGSTIDSTSSLAGDYGTLELDTSTGEYTYTPDSSSIEALNAGQSVSDLFRISVSDTMALDSTEFQVLITGASEQARRNGGGGRNNTNDQDTQTPEPQAPKKDRPETKTPPLFPSSKPENSTIPSEKTAKVGVGLPCEFKRQKNNDGKLLITGSHCNDTFSGGDKHDILRGGQGTDNINGRKGKDLLRGHQDADTIFGGRGRDSIAGGRGNDLLRGKRGHDRINGKKDHDMIRGGRGKDKLRGGEGEDTLRGGSKNDTLIGGPDADHFYLSPGRDQIKDFSKKEGDHIINKRNFEITIQQIGAHLLITDRDRGLHTKLIGIEADQLLEIYPEWG
ncbi:Ig-like domain-containing protein [Synechococcus sp. KORDI-100]|uniref:VCBS domain-containing protein n=1 Tax=Synechococcus sp. KORDI-100 TaxID=1280380 RepID=UPI001EF6FDE2|nr:Ig-like domain-containing protein [Synechococcus sp. KORDI-100]